MLKLLLLLLLLLLLEDACQSLTVAKSNPYSPHKEYSKHKIAPLSCLVRVVSAAGKIEPPWRNVVRAAGEIARSWLG